MSLTSSDAKSMADSIHNLQPVFATTGERKGSHVKKAYKYLFPSSPERHISIVRADTENGVTAYINNISVSGSEYQKINGVVITKTYLKGYEGKDGNKGMSAAAAGLSSLNPKKNEVHRLSVSSKLAFQNLLNWYFGNSEETTNSLVLELDTTANKKMKSDEINTTIDSINSEAYALELLEDIAAIEEDEDDGPAEKQELKNARIGQGKFRKNTTAIWGGDEKCAVTGLQIPALLNASHIKPWRDCDSKREKLSGCNGILLCVHLDRLFDRYLIGFEKTSMSSFKIRSLICSPKLKSKFSLLGIIGISDSLNLDLSRIEGRDLVELEKNLDIHLAKVKLEV